MSSSDVEDDYDEQAALEAEIDAAITRGIPRERIQHVLDEALVDQPDETTFSMMVATLRLRALG